jgi:hypothetical protein
VKGRNRCNASSRVPVPTFVGELMGAYRLTFSGIGRSSLAFKKTELAFPAF